MKICLSCEGISATDLQVCGSCGTELLPIESVHYPLRRGEEDAGNPLLGTRIDGKFRVTSVLGKGGMGTVFRAVHEVSLVPVALKVLHPRYAARADYREGFLAEARKAGRVVHENCARILDVGQAEDGTVYIAQELVEGETLDEWIHAEEAVAPADAVEILVQICRALVASHVVGLVHRDLSTRNVMVVFRDGQPFVKILDFGIAKGAPARVGQEADARGSQATASFANPAYSAPEQLAGQDVDARADLYSLGVIAYEALCGRLPVEGETGRDLARATVEGRLRPLPSIPGVPSQLSRLVERLLARDPERRPGSAKEVLGILERIQRPKGLALRPLAVGLMIAGMLLTLVAYTTDTSEPFLRVRPGNPLDLATNASEVQVQEVRSDTLARAWQFDFGGFRPDALRVEVSRGSSLAVVAEVGDDGAQLILSPTDPGYRSLLETLRSESAGGEPVDLTFRVEGYPPLGYARVLVDDQPPVLTLYPVDQDHGVVPETKLGFSVQELGTPEHVTLRVRSGGETVEAITLNELQLEAGFLPVGDMLQASDYFRAAAGVHAPVEFVLEATDTAGNSSVSPVVVVPFVDLKAPAIEAVSARGEGYTVTYAPDRVTLRVTLDEMEPGLEVLVWDLSGARRICRSPEPAGGNRIDVDLGPFHPGDDPPFINGRYRFQLRDRAGNLSEEFPQELSFLPEDIQLGFTADAANAAVLDPRSLVTDGRPVEFQLHCNEAYRPISAIVQGDGPPTTVPLQVVEPGLYTLSIGALGSGTHNLRIGMRDISRDREREISATLRVLSSPPVLSLPDTGQARFLSELDGGLFRVDGEGLARGQGWRLEPEDWRLLRGDLWFGPAESQVRFPINLDAAQELLFTGLNPLPGENHLDLALEDVLGRAVSVTLGENPAPLALREPGQTVQRVATFQYQSRPPEPREEVRVEYGQPARLFILSPLPFLNRDEILLRWSQSRLTPRSRSPLENGGTQLEFDLPFEDLANATDGRQDLQDVRAEDYADGDAFGLRVILQTPAGEYPLALSLRTSRSVLTDVTLQELAGGRDLPPALGELSLVPVLAPSPIFPDPVPAGLAARPLYRLTPRNDVRTQDVYLQGSELSRAQYQAAVAAFLSLDESQRGPSRLLVHSADPLGASRLTRPGMLPTRLAGDGTLWRAGLAAGDRPVTGVDFFQAYTLTRIVGLLVDGDPELLRLPLGVEMEMAALGAAPTSGFALNGLRGAVRADVVRAHEDALAARDDRLHWPPTAVESAGLGDAVTTGQGYRLVALDFGVREWVLDLPYSVVLEKDALLREWGADQGGHVVRALDLARGTGLDPTLRELQGHLATFGVVRGLALGEPHLLVDGEHGGDLRRVTVEILPPTLPGVVRVLQLRRDGRDLLEDQVDPRLQLVGLRLAGGAEFVRRVRAR